jgi:hypothetical protein
MSKEFKDKIVDWTSKAGKGHTYKLDKILTRVA